jgi:hypothetical protein
MRALFSLFSGHRNIVIASLSLFFFFLFVSVLFFCFRCCCCCWPRFCAFYFIQCIALFIFLSVCGSWDAKERVETRLHLEF